MRLRGCSSPVLREANGLRANFFEAPSPETML
jgi:hypothetical protein